MGGETEQEISGWTVDTLKAHLEQLMNDRDRRYEQRFQAQSEAVAVADKANEKRFDSVNEFRGTLSDQSRQMMPRAESEAKHRNTQEKLDALTVIVSGLLPRAEYDRAHAELIQKVDAQGRSTDSALAAINKRLDTDSGLKQGGVETRAAMVALISVVATLIVIGGFVAAIWPK